MASIIGLSGAHGTGKSTILAALAARCLPNVVVDTFSIARSVQNEYGQDLQTIVSNPDNVPAYQKRIRTRKAEHLAELASRYGNDTFIFTDRTPIDFFAYAKLWAETNVVAHEWLTTYRYECASDLREYTKVFLVPPRKFPFVVEQQRASEATQRKHHEYCKSFIRTFARPHKMVTPLDVEKRVDYCLHHAGVL